MRSLVRCLLWLVVLNGCFHASFARAEVLDQVVSRESPLFNCKTARMTVGRDGLVYLTGTTNGKGFCLRLARDGSAKLGGEVVYAIHNATANKDGLIATANAHFSHSLNLYDASFNKQHAQDDFLVNDQVGWDAPLHVEAGSQSGEFFGLDQHRNRIVRVGVDGKVKAVYPVRAEHEEGWGQPQSFRVSEPLQSFFYLSKGHWIRSKFDGSVVWKSKLPVHFDWSSGGHGGFDIDDAGTTYFVEATSDVLKRLDADGKPLPDVKLDFTLPIRASTSARSQALPGNASTEALPQDPSSGASQSEQKAGTRGRASEGASPGRAWERVVAIRVFGNDLVLRRESPTELFEVFDLATGKLKHVESIVYERLTVTFPSLVWTNGEKVPLKIAFAQSQQAAAARDRETNRIGTKATKGTNGNEINGPNDEKPIRPSGPISPTDSSREQVPHHPRFRVWLTPFGISDWQELERDAESNIVVPADYAGLYQLKISPEVTPRQTAEPSEYLVREIIEVRKPNSQGTIAVVTPLNRSRYECSETIVGKVIARLVDKPVPPNADLRIRKVTRDARNQRILGDLMPVTARRPAPEGGIPVVGDAKNSKRDEFPRSLSVSLVEQENLAGTFIGKFSIEFLHRVLEPGEYLLELDVATLTCVPQLVVIEDNTRFSWQDFRTTLYGDYGITFPQRNAWESADAAIAHGERMQKLGFNQFVNRANWQLSLDFANDDNGRRLLNRVKERLQKDPLAVTPEKAEFGSAHHQILEHYSANGWRELLLLVNMDGGLPIGTGFDTRKPEQFAASIKSYTEAFASYGAFAGWTWGANWWLFDANAKFKTPDEKPKYEAALKIARETGKWDPILDQVEDRKFQFAVDAQESFNKTLREIENRAHSISSRPGGHHDSGRGRGAGGEGPSGTDTQKSSSDSNSPSPLTPLPGVPGRGEQETRLRRFTTASAGPYRRPEVLNDINFRNVNEIDVQYQAEQITTPDWLHHAVDNAKRFGQPAWTHPELWNDFGTGEQILPMSWLAVMRGAGGIGTAGTVPNWPNVALDSRTGYHGTTSVFRALNRVFANNRLGPLANAVAMRGRELLSDDRVGIVVSPRQVKIETFGNGVGSPTFSRQFEAYQSLLYANCAARFVSLEEVRERTRSQALPGNASTEAPPRESPSGTLQSEQKTEPRGRASDRAFPGRVLERVSAPFDALLLVGQTVELEPEWQAFLKQAKAAGVRVFADGTCRREVCLEAEDLKLKFDFVETEHSANNDHAFYTYPVRFLANADALQPLVNELKAKSKRPKDNVTLVRAVSPRPGNPGRGAGGEGQSSSEGEPQDPSFLPNGAKGTNLNRPVVLIRELSNADSSSRIVFVVNNTPTTLEPGQLRRVGRAISTRSPVLAHLKFDVPAGYGILDMLARRTVEPEFIADLRDTYGRLYVVAPQYELRKMVTNSTTLDEVTQAMGIASSDDRALLDRSFGPHLRDVAISHDGKTALLNAFNWDDNLYGLDLETGRALPSHRVKFRGRVGDHFAYAPKATKAGFFVQGFDLNTAEGYQLYVLTTRSQALPGNASGEALPQAPPSGSTQAGATQAESKTEARGRASEDASPGRAWERVGVARRYSLPALPGCLTGWAFTAWIQDRVNNFAVPTSGEWVAGSGNLGIAVWKRDGELLWAQDWSREKRQTCLIEALDESTLLVAEGRVLKAVAASTGKAKWHVLLADSGEVHGLHPARDGKSVAVRTNTSGGTVFVVREGAVVAKLLTAADDLSQSEDGSLIAVTTGHQLRAFELGMGRTGLMGRMKEINSDAIRPSGPSSPIASVVLSWLAHGDDQLRFPRVSADGRHIAVSSELGTVYVFSREGRKLHERDEFSICVPAWLPNDDLLLASWMGTVTRVDVEFKTLWRTHVRDGEKLDVGAVTRSQALPGNASSEALPQVPATGSTQTEEKTGTRGRASGPAFPGRAWERVRAEAPTSRVTSWIAATDKITERKNLLEPNQFIAKFMLGDFAATPNHPVNELVDGKWDAMDDSLSPVLRGEGRGEGPTTTATPKSPSPPAPLPGVPGRGEKHASRDAWLNWLDHGMIESGWRGEFALVLDSFNKQLRVDSLTFIEDPEHPESWLRDMQLEYWNADAEKWVFAEYLTSDSAVHHHKLKKSIEAARFRFVKADGHAWPAGNVRLQEVMLHGEVIGASHPDVVAKRPIAVLFDENVASVKGSYEHGHNFGLKFATGAEAFSGGNYITLPGDKNYSALWQPPFGHMTPNWWFEVVEKPEPGQYRFLQFSVKALAPETRGITLRVAPNHFGGVAVHVGEATKSDGAVFHQATGAVPFEWHTVTVDLWELLPENQRNKPFNIGAMSLGTVGGPAAMDRIRLGRTKENLQK